MIVGWCAAGQEYMRTCPYRLEDMTPNSKQISGVQKGLQDQPTLPADALAPSFTMVS